MHVVIELFPRIDACISVELKRSRLSASDMLVHLQHPPSTHRSSYVPSATNFFTIPTSPESVRVHGVGYPLVFPQDSYVHG